MNSPSGSQSEDNDNDATETTNASSDAGEDRKPSHVGGEAKTDASTSTDETSTLPFDDGRKSSPSTRPRTTISTPTPASASASTKTAPKAKRRKQTISERSNNPTPSDGQAATLPPQPPGPPRRSSSSSLNGCNTMPDLRRDTSANSHSSNSSGASLMDRLLVEHLMIETECFPNDDDEEEENSERGDDEELP